MSAPKRKEIRDPLHGAIPVDSHERAVIDSPYVQRLRGIRQLGFAHLPFPGATHSRYNHSLGVMHLAYYPDDFVEGHPELKDLRRGMSLAVYPMGLDL